MPNHIHGIIIINNVETEHCSVPTKHCSVDTGYRRDYGLLSKVIKSFKEKIIKHVRKDYHDFEFAWQRSFYDHIIRSEKSLDKIRSYIKDNSRKWFEDKYNQNPSTFIKVKV